MTAAVEASLEHRMVAPDCPLATEIRDVLSHLTDDDWDRLADPSGPLPRIVTVRTKLKPSGRELRSWFFSPASDAKLAPQLSYYVYAVWKALASDGLLGPEKLGVAEPDAASVRLFLDLTAEGQGPGGPRLAYTGLACRYGVNSATAETAWRVISAPRAVTAQEVIPSPAYDADDVTVVIPDASLTAGFARAAANLRGTPERDSSPRITDGGRPDSATAGAGSARSRSWVDSFDDGADAAESDTPDQFDIDPADAAEIAAHEHRYRHDQDVLEGLLARLRDQRPLASASAGAAIDAVQGGRPLTDSDQQKLDEWSLAVVRATETVRDVTGLQPKPELPSLEVAVETWLNHLLDVGAAKEAAAHNRQVLAHLNADRAQHERSIAAIQDAIGPATPQVREALADALHRAEAELVSINGFLRQALERQNQLEEQQQQRPVLPVGATVPRQRPDPNPPADAGLDAVSTDEDATGMAASSPTSAGVRWWPLAWLGVLVLGCADICTLLAGTVGNDRLAWSLAAMAWWTLIGPIALFNAPVRWRWTGVLGLAIVAALFGTWAYQTSGVCGSTPMLVALGSIPLGLGLGALAIFLRSRLSPGEFNQAAGPSGKWLAALWIGYAFSLVFFVSVLATPLQCAG